MRAFENLIIKCMYHFLKGWKTKKKLIKSSWSSWLLYGIICCDLRSDKTWDELFDKAFPNNTYKYIHKFIPPSRMSARQTEIYLLLSIAHFK